MKNLIFLVSSLTVAAAGWAQTYEHRVVAAVLMGEAWNQGREGMLAVGEVIHQRAVEKGRTPQQIVTARHGARHAFSCLNRTTPDRLIEKFKYEPVYDMALQVAVLVCDHPERLSGRTQGATHYTRVEETPRWARGKKPIVIVGRHAFYRIKQY